MMQSPLLGNTEMIENISTDGITSKTVLMNYEILLENGGNIHPKLGAIIDAMGGIDMVLRQYLDHTPKQNQLCEINDIILSLNNTKSSDSELQNMDTTENPVIYLSINDTIMNRLWKSENVEKYKQKLSGNIATCMAIFIAISLIIDYCTVYWFWWEFKDAFVHALNNYSSVSMTIGIVWLLLNAMYLNVKAMKEISRSFEQWFKLVYYIRGCVCWNIYAFKAYGYHEPTFMAAQNLTLLAYLILFFEYTMIDGLYYDRKRKALMTVVGCIIFTVIAFSFTWTDFTKDNPSRYIYVYGFQWDVLSYASNSMRIVCIFLWKQTIFSLWHPDQAVMIYKPVVLKWM